MPHLGRHPNAYHRYMLEGIRNIDTVAKGNQSIFLNKFNTFKQTIINNPNMLRKNFWK